MSTLVRRLSAVLTACVLCFAASRAQAAGLFFSDRGVRSMGRAGAHVAGADDLNAVVYNPAALGGMRSTALFDATYIHLNVEHTRRLDVEDSGGTLQRVDGPTVHGSSAFLPIPTIALGYQVLDDLTVAFSIYGPYVSMLEFPKTVGGQPSPARYALGSFDDSRLAFAALAAGYRVADWLSLGAGLHVLAGTFRSKVTFNIAPPDRVIAAPEDPDYDALSQLSVGPIFALSPSAGIVLKPLERLRIGLSYQARTTIHSDATIKVRLPETAAFDEAQVKGDRASIRMIFPAVLRAGVELSLSRSLRVEAAYVREFWSAHEDIRATPHGVQITGVPGAPSDLSLPGFSIPRGFRDSNSYRLGGELDMPAFGKLLPSLRAGVSYDRSAVPPSRVSLNSFDLDKVLLTFGASIQIGAVRLDALYAHAVVFSRRLSPQDAELGRIFPFSGNAKSEPINGGSYAMRGQLIGVGMQYAWGGRQSSPEEERE